MNAPPGLLRGSGRLVEHSRGLPQIYSHFGLAGVCWRGSVSLGGSFICWTSPGAGRQAELVLSSVSWAPRDWLVPIIEKTRATSRRRGLEDYAMGSACCWHERAIGPPRIGRGWVSCKVTLERAQLLGCGELFACALLDHRSILIGSRSARPVDLWSRCFIV